MLKWIDSGSIQKPQPRRSDSFTANDSVTANAVLADMLAADRTSSMPWDPAPQQMGVPTHRVPSIGLPYRMVMNEDTRQCELSSTMVRPYWVLTINPPGSEFDSALHYVPSLKFSDQHINGYPHRMASQGGREVAHSQPGIEGMQAHRAATRALAPQTESKQRQRTSIGGHEISEDHVPFTVHLSSEHYIIKQD